MAFADLDDLRMHYELSGDASLPVLVFSNSLGADLKMWEPQLSTLESRYCVLRYDTRGHGSSSVPPGPYKIDRLAEDVLDLLDELEIEQASFCGLSLGGVTGQWLGVYARHRLHKLILSNTAAKIGTDETWNARIATVTESGLDSIAPATMERWFTQSFRDAQPQVVAATAEILRSTNPEGYVACCAAIRDADFRSKVREIKTPTLIITGTHDPVTTPDDGRVLAENIAGGRFVELPAAHLSNTEAAAAFNTALLEFLES